MISQHEEEFARFHEANPHIYEMVKRFAFEAMASGKRTFGISAIIERARWEKEVVIERGQHVDPEESFSLSNNHKPYYARLFLSDHPQHAEFFITHPTKAERDREQAAREDSSQPYLPLAEGWNLPGAASVVTQGDFFV